jgi:hypothetical protein
MLDERDEGVLAGCRYETWLSFRTIRQEEKARHLGGSCRSWHFSAFWRAVRQLAESAGRIQVVALKTRGGGRAVVEYANRTDRVRIRCTKDEKSIQPSFTLGSGLRAKGFALQRDLCLHDPEVCRASEPMTRHK